MRNKKLTGLLIVLTLFTGLSAAQGITNSLDIEVLDTEPAPLQSGEYATIWIRMTNTGDVEASNPEFEVVENFPFTPTDNTTYSPNSELGPGETYTRPVEVKVSENAAFGNNSLEIRKSTGNSNSYTTENINLEVRTDDRSLIISAIDFPKHIEPGSSAKMTLQLETLANSDFRNIDVSLDTSELPIATRGSSRQRLSSVGPDNPGEVNFTIDVDDDADNQLHNLPIQIDYQNQAGQELSVSETTGVNIGGEPNIDVDIDSSDIRSEGRGEVTFQVLNRGEGQARFTEIELGESNQYEILSENSEYLGSMIADDYQTATFDIYVEEGENLELPVTVNYRDGQGDQTEEFNIERKLYTGSELRNYGLEQSGASWPVIILILGLVGAGIYYWRKKRNQE